MVNVDYKTLSQNKDILFDVNKSVIKNTNLWELTEGKAEDYSLKTKFNALETKKVKLANDIKNQPLVETVAKVVFIGGLALLGAGIAGVVLASSAATLELLGALGIAFGAVGAVAGSCMILSERPEGGSFSKIVAQEEEALVKLANELGQMQVLNTDYAKDLKERADKHGQDAQYADARDFMDKLVAYQNLLKK